MAELIERGLLTDDGKKVVAWFEAQMPDRASDAFVDAFNALPGHVKHYLTTVKVSGILTAESWITDYPASAQAGCCHIDVGTAGSSVYCRPRH